MKFKNIILKLKKENGAIICSTLNKIAELKTPLSYIEDIYAEDVFYFFV